MLVNQWLVNTTKKLEDNNILTARLDCLVLLEDATSKDRSYLIAHPELHLDDQRVDILNQLIARRTKHEPLAYIRGKTEFYGQEFIINEHVLEPRPESETMIELLLSLRLPAAASTVDVGTGSGVLGITAKLEMPSLKVDLIDNDHDALVVAERNVHKFGLDLVCIERDLLAGITKKYDVILANLPYVPDDHAINDAAKYEPKSAIFGGQDGLDLYRRLFAQIQTLPDQCQFILTESMPFQHTELKKIAQRYGYIQRLVRDFIQVFAPL